MKKAIITSIAAVALLAIFAVPALAEGYNNGNWNFTTQANEQVYGENAGLYVREPGSSTETTVFSGPHGDYTTTSNKCQDCHSTHYATGSYRLLRADSRTEACDFCHTGGGGSKTNIMMDNSYSATSAIVGANQDMGAGTGHTLGYKGNAPSDIRPAFSDSAGLACFDCHTPHGNSARVLEPFADPGRKMGGKVVKNVYKVGQATGTIFQAGPVDITSVLPTAGTYWGLTVDEGNYDLFKNGVLMKKPVWPKGRFLLLKDPDSNDGTDTVLAAVGSTAGTSTGVPTKKFAISWDDPIGPADAAFGGDDAARAANPSWNNTTTPNYMWPNGLAAVSEMCSDCHGGSAGLSNQPANVWKPDPNDSTTGAYMVAYSHDSQPRH